jgi:uncharacterized membrane protein
VLFYFPYWLHFSSPASGLRFVPPAKSSPALQLAIIWVIHLYFPFVFLLLRNKFKGELRALTGICILAFILVAFVEVAYFKDIYPQHFRANTMFKIGISVWFWSSMVSAALIVMILNDEIKWGRQVRYVQMAVAGLLLGSGIFYVVKAVPQSFVLQTKGNMDGLDFMRKKDPSDLNLIEWIRKNIVGQPVLVEAVGDSFSEHGRISVFTGLPNIIQWPVHAWLWRGSYDRSFKPKSNLEKARGAADTVGVRVGDVQLLYETEDVGLAKVILDKYKAGYLVIGRMERAKYPNLKEAKFDQLGEVVFRNENVKLYKVHN